MQAVHELGHALAGWATGGTVTKIVLHPLAISRTDVAPNPHPLVVVWGGPLVGIMLPLLLVAVFYFLRLSGTYLIRFFAGFCLIANGAYIGIGSFEGIGDAGEMLRNGSPIWLLWLYGVVTLPLGFWQWHGLGPYFGLGAAKGHVEIWSAYVSLILLIMTILLTVTFSSLS